ncbi:MAG TPA: DUF5979 domain-containing protein [Acidimicrobiia bacterium]|nr:DUF5979 domain-containing protein [Acidimicrobiia bacterium]
MRHTIRKPRFAAILGVVAVVAATTVALGVSSASAASASDPTRANFVGGNAVNCAKVGFPNSTLAFADGNDGIDDGFVSGTVVPNTSSIGTGKGEMVNVDDPTGGAVIDAVVVKGGPAYNVYSQNSGAPAANHVPPTEDTPTEYVSPFNGGGNIPAVSHWFICYHGGEPPEFGSLVVTKNLIPPQDGVTGVPASFNIIVKCPTDGSDVNETLVLTPVDDGDGNFSDSEEITGIPLGDQCVVSEDMTGINPLVTVTIVQPGPITVGGAEATVTNDFGGISPENVVRPADPAAAVVVAPAFTG